MENVSVATDSQLEKKWKAYYLLAEKFVLIIIFLAGKKKGDC